MGEGLSGPQEEPVLLSQKEGRGTEGRLCGFSQGRGLGELGLLLSVLGGLWPRRMGRTCCCQLLYAKVFLVFLCFYFLS